VGDVVVDCDAVCPGSVSPVLGADVVWPVWIVGAGVDSAEEVGLAAWEAVVTGGVVPAAGAAVVGEVMVAAGVVTCGCVVVAGGGVGVLGCVVGGASTVVGIALEAIGPEGGPLLIGAGEVVCWPTGWVAGAVVAGGGVALGELSKPGSPLELFVPAGAEASAGDTTAA
jgi:hypothetical protein